MRVFDVGAGGLLSGYHRFGRASAAISLAHARSEDAALVHHKVEQIQSHRQVQAAAQLIRAEDEALGTLIDTIA